jgi:hypothetical protein
MDWTKVKSMIIYIFIVLNIFLFTNISYLTKDKEVSQDIINSVEKFLKNNGVNLICSIPKSSKNINAYAKYDIDLEQIIKKKSNLDEKIKIISDNELEIKYNKVPKYFIDNEKEKIKKKLISISKELNLDIDNCYFDEYEEKNEKITGELFFVKENVILFDNKIKYEIYNGKLKISFKYYGYRVLNGSKVGVMPVYQILVKNFMNYSTTIYSIDIGVKTSKIDSLARKNHESSLTVWRIKQKYGVRYFNAATGVEVYDEE